MGSKLSRRSFLKLTGVAVGSGLAYSKFGGLKLSALSPAEATGTDDEKWKHTACALCLMCPMQVKVKNGKIVDVRGEDIYPWKGRVCAKAYGGIWGRVYAPDRIIYPLKRVGKRGEGKFVRCSWDEVITNFSKKLKEYMDEGHPEAFEIWWGCPVQADNMYFLHYFSRIMGCSISYMHGQICFGDHTSEKSVTFGGSRAGDLVNGTADYINTKYAVIAAQNFPGTVFAPGTQCGASAFWPVYLKAKENGMRHLSVDPKLTDSGALANEWIPIKPGTDGAFAYGVANVLIKEKLYDEDFLLKYTNAPQLIRVDTKQAMKDDAGKYLAWDSASNSAIPLPPADQRGNLSLGIGKTYTVGDVQCKTALTLYAEESEKYPPEKVIEICELPFLPDKIVEIARNLGNNKPAVLFYPGFTTGRYTNWFQVLRIYSCVNMLLGNIERPGGWYFPKHKFNTGTGWPEPPEVPEYPNPDLKVVPGSWGNLMSVELLDKAPCYKEPRDFHPATVALPWDHFTAMQEGKVKALFSTAENSAITQVNTDYVYDCLNKLEMIVVGDQLPKDFIEMADYVLPEAAYVERNQLFTFSALGQDGQEHATAIMRSRTIELPGEVKTVTWFFTEVSKRIGLGAYFENIDTDYGWWNKMLKHAKLPVTAEELVENGPYVEKYPMTYDVMFKPIETRSGRFEMYSNELAEECYFNEKSIWYESQYIYPVPCHIPIAEPKGKDEFYLVSGKASWHQKSATQNNRYLMEDEIEGGCPFSPLYINAERASELGLKEGDMVEVECVGPTKQEEPHVFDDSAIGYKQKVRVHITEGLHPSVAFTHFAAGHKAKSMLPKAREGVLHSAFVPLTVEPYGGGCGKNYSIVRLRKG